MNSPADVIKINKYRIRQFVKAIKPKLISPQQLNCTPYFKQIPTPSMNFRKEKARVIRNPVN